MPGQREADVGQDRDQRVAQHVAEQHRRLGQALGARGAHVVVAQLVEEEAAVQARLRRQPHHHRQQHRQRRVDDQVRPRAVAPALHREPAELEAEHVLADDHVDQERDRQRHRGAHHDRAVGQRAAHVGHAQRDRDRDQRVQDQDRQRHRERGGQPRGHQVRDGLVGGPAAAPVEGDDALDEQRPAGTTTARSGPAAGGSRRSRAASRSGWPASAPGRRRTCGTGRRRAAPRPAAWGSFARDDGAGRRTSSRGGREPRKSRV